ncbi:MAG TPA: phosphatidylglycerophosphatase A [Gammaproteobacteria bacterium]
MENTNSTRPTWRELWRNPAHLLAFGFGAGLSPKAPGTAGTLVAVPVYLLAQQMSYPAQIVLLVAVIMAGIWICDRTASDLKVHDHPGIVWDEIAGFLLTMSAVDFSWFNLAAGFLLFRCFDILKPWPISYFDRNVQGGLGIMLDDIVAGICAASILYLVQYFL